MKNLTKGLVGLTLVALSACSILPKTPHSNAEFAKTSAMITLENRRSGGSGVILRSTANSSTILTNKHVCGLIQNGGIVTTDEGTYPIVAFKVYTQHDLCLIQVMANLHTNTKVAEKPPEVYSNIIVAGHPALLPTIVSKGHFSSKSVIQLMVDSKPCDGTETDPQDAFFCIFTGSKPVVQSFEAQATSALIMPGSSGSGVFNDKGEISGLVFAGPGEGLGYGFIVPYEYVKDFLGHLKKYPTQYPDKNKKTRNLFLNPIALEQVCLVNTKKCKNISFSALYTEHD